MASYTVCCPDITAPDAKMNLLLSINLHYDGAWGTTVCCTEATALGMTTNLKVSTTYYDDDAW